MRLVKTILTSILILLAIQSYADYPTSGVLLNGTILPNGAFPTHVADWGYGGWHTSTNASLIPDYLRPPGTAVWNPDTETLFVFSGTSGGWEELIDLESSALWSDLASTSGEWITTLEDSMIAADTAVSNAFVSADVVVTDAYIAADVVVTDAYVAADTVVSNAFVAADVVVTDAFGAADTVVSNAFVSADTVVTDAFIAADTVVSNAFVSADTAVTGAFGDADTVVTDAFIAADVVVADAFVAADVVVTGAFGDADTVISNAFVSADTVVTDAYVAADTVVTDAYIAADVIVTDDFIAADVVVTDAYVAADTVVSGAFVAADSTLSNDLEGDIHSAIYGETVWDEPITSSWTAIVDSLASITNEHPRGLWFRYATDKQYVDAEEQLVLIVRDDGGGASDGYTIGAAVVLPTSYFPEGAGEYHLIFKIVEYRTANSRLAVNITGANIGSGGASNYYAVKTRRAGAVGNPLEIDVYGNASIEPLNDLIYNPTDHPEDIYYVLDFTYDGVDDVVLQFGGAGANVNLNNGVVIDDISISRDGDISLLTVTDDVELLLDGHSYEIFGNVFFEDTITPGWTATVDSDGAQIDTERPKEVWVRYASDRQYVDGAEQLVLKVRDDVGDVSQDGYTAGVGISLPASYFDGAGEYHLSFNLAEYLTDRSQLLVKISSANIGSGGELNYYTIKTQFTGWEAYGEWLYCPATGDATSTVLNKHMYDPENYEAGNSHLLSFYYGGVDDIVIQFAGAGNNNSAANGVIIDDISITKGGSDYIRYHIARTDNPHEVSKLDVDVDITHSLIETAYPLPIYYSKVFDFWYPVSGASSYKISNDPALYPTGEWFTYWAGTAAINNEKELVLQTDWQGYTIGFAHAIDGSEFTSSGTYQLRFLLKEYLKPYSTLYVRVFGANYGTGGALNYYTIYTHVPENYSYLDMGTTGDATSTILAQRLYNVGTADPRQYYILEFEYDATTGDDVVIQFAAAQSTGDADKSGHGVVMDDVKVLGVLDDSLKADIDADNVIADDTFRLNIGLGTASTNATETFIQSTEINQNSGVAGLDVNGLISTNVIPNIIVIFTGGAR